MLRVCMGAIMENGKRSKGTTESKKRDTRKRKARDTNGKIKLENCTLEELKAYAASTKYAANRNIVRAAIQSIKALEGDPRMVLCKVTFGLKPVVLPLSKTTQEKPRARRTRER